MSTSRARLTPARAPAESGASSSLTNSSYSPDGSRLAYTSGTGVYLGVFDLASGRRIGFGPYCDGRMGEHAALRWTPDGQRVWYAFVSGVMDVHWMQFGPGQRSGGLGTKGTAPVFGAQGRGFTCLVDARLRALDGATGETLWETTVATLGQQVATLLEKR